MARKCALMCIAVIAGVVSTWASMRGTRPVNVPGNPQVRIEILNAAADGTIHSESMRWTPIRFRLTNLGEDWVRGLEFETPFSTRIEGPIPAEVAPRSSFEAEIQVKGPPRGKMNYKVPVYGGRVRHALGWLTAVVQTPISPPLLASRLTDVRLTVVEGDENVPELRLATIESDFQNPWIEELLCEPADMARITLADVTQRSDTDPRYCLRNYVFSISPTFTGYGVSSGTLTLKVAGDSGIRPPPVSLRIERLRRLAVFPSEIEFGPDNEPVRVSVVDRLGTENPSIRVRDLDNVTVRSVSDLPNLFEIVPLIIPDTRQARLVVECGSVEPVEIPLRWSGYR